MSCRWIIRTRLWEPTSASFTIINCVIIRTSQNRRSSICWYRAISNVTDRFQRKISQRNSVLFAWNTENLLSVGYIQRSACIVFYLYHIYTYTRTFPWIVGFGSNKNPLYHLIIGDNFHSGHIKQNKMLKIY